VILAVRRYARVIFGSLRTVVNSEKTVLSWIGILNLTGNLIIGRRLIYIFISSNLQENCLWSRIILDGAEGIAHCWR